MPALPQVTHDDSSRFDFIEGVRAYNYAKLVGPLLDEYDQRVAAHVDAGNEPPRTKEEAGRLYDRDATYLFACGIQRSMQELAWATAAESVQRDADPIAEILNSTRDSQEFSTLELDLSLSLPDWYTSHDREGRDDIHLVSGGYWREDLVGAIYERGGAVYRLAWRKGYGAGPGALEAFVRTAAPRETYESILDLGCAFGGLTGVLRSVYPDARVTGIDLSAPALKYAHHVAEQKQQAIVYSQRDATATGYPDGSFDLVTAFLLLHEVPDDVREEMMQEAFRLLEPGGHIIFLDIPPYRVLNPAEAYVQSFDSRGNGETFWDDYLSSDFPALLERVGFTDVHEGPLDFAEEAYWGSAALWRTGSFNPVHRWVTRAVKPS